LLLPGDRFIIRQFSPVVTIGGGVVLDAAPIKQTAERVRQFLETLANRAAADILSARLIRRGAGGLDLKTAIGETGWLESDLEQVAAELVRSGSAVRCGSVLVAAQEFEQSANRAVEIVKKFHQANPLVAGMGKEQLREQLELREEVFAAVLSRLEREKKLQSAGELIQIAGRAIVMSQDEAQSKQTIERAFANAGLKVPALKDVLGSLKIDRDRAQRIVTLLLRDKVLVKLSDELVFHH
jgi:selenocysteine-specific elongation factor